MLQSAALVRSVASRASATAAVAAAVPMRAKHTLPDMPYDYSALEPVISAEIMKIHHSKHHQAYVNNLNIAEEKYAEATAKNDLSAQIALQSAIKFNGGGHINHSIFWTNLAPASQSGSPSAELNKAINAEFGSFDAFVEKFNTQTAAVQGSGWGWLGYDKTKGRVVITACANQDPLQALTGHTPLLGIDVWEHAYYLQYKNARPDYLKAIWKVVNWNNVNERFAAASRK
ncbi:iron/manganese superoxide dismutase [Capsaspora owczarzaki ATCC 30864]|uniref:Superoxide dismutase n=1 Tax=Capsaspora owczarzaki (strain ATCC 30864) TaxID=595528 RepID=A0A0D2X060_CAPO3|nr:iron/manganese superoxide dismutase [Capsaspora owczarzaki ATCC 30864]KJE88494.1 iron/manganese superoxide dismutase [Capsaspora owczarzaki ATCC 30864]|eukprot:XP_004365015.1 iron/manganese superoxide dismutase [Capsaspora owczarzaki ATCC 30864]